MEKHVIIDISTGRIDYANASAAATMREVKRLAQKGVRVIGPDTLGEGRVRNSARGMSGRRAYELSGLKDRMLLKYGVAHITEKLLYDTYPTIKAAHDALKPLLPQNKTWQGRPATAINAMLKTNAKTTKTLEGKDVSYETNGLSLAPYQLAFRPYTFSNTKGNAWLKIDTDPKAKPVSLAGLRTKTSYSTCPGSSSECRASCLAFSGQNALQVIAFVAKASLTRALYDDPVAFMRLLLEAVRKYFFKVAKDNVKTGKEVVPFVRLNVYSDIIWEELFPDLMNKPNVANRHPDAAPKRIPRGTITGNGSFYDYTKVANRVTKPGMYHLTYSFSGDNTKETKAALKAGRNVAVVFLPRYHHRGKRKAKTPYYRAGGAGAVIRKHGIGTKTYPKPGHEFYPWKLWGYEVINGDKSDVRPLDKPGCIVGLGLKIPRVKIGPKKFRHLIDPHNPGKFVTTVEVVHDDQGEEVYLIAETPDQTF